MIVEKLYRPCVGIALFNRQGLVFVGERIDTPGSWQMPQGGIDADEDIERAARRELEEETGITSALTLKIAERTIRYDLPDDMRNGTGERKALWNGKYAGQEQSWVAMRFTGEIDEINLNAHHPPEFSAWQWMKMEDTLGLIVPFKREAYMEVISMFRDVGLP